MKAKKLPFALSQLCMLALIAIVLWAPKARSTVRAPWSMLVAIGIIELLFFISLHKSKRKAMQTTGSCDIIIFVWILLIAWELTTSVFNLPNPVLFPAPENVFDTFRGHWRKMLTNTLYSMQLLGIGYSSGLLLGVFCGMFAGWIPRLRNFARPIANVIAPIPAIVFSPYLVAIMPTFRSASILVILLGVFWPTLLTTIQRVVSMDRRILDSARMLNLSDASMIFKIILPYVIPGIVNGLKVSVTTSILMLNFAELMGATHGLGYYVQNAITYANYTQAVAGIFCIGIVVTILNRLVSYIQLKAIRWR